jgi:hypothetical protein
MKIQNISWDQETVDHIASARPIKDHCQRRAPFVFPIQNSKKTTVS